MHKETHERTVSTRGRVSSIDPGLGTEKAQTQGKAGGLHVETSVWHNTTGDSREVRGTGKNIEES